MNFMAETSHEGRCESAQIDLPRSQVGASESGSQADAACAKSVVGISGLELRSKSNPALTWIRVTFGRALTPTKVTQNCSSVAHAASFFRRMSRPRLRRLSVQ